MGRQMKHEARIARLKSLEREIAYQKRRVDQLELELAVVKDNLADAKCHLAPLTRRYNGIKSHTPRP